MYGGKIKNLKGDLKMLRVVLRVHPGMMSPRSQPQCKLQGVFVNLPHVI